MDADKRARAEAARKADPPISLFDIILPVAPFGIPGASQLRLLSPAWRALHVAYPRPDPMPIPAQSMTWVSDSILKVRTVRTAMLMKMRILESRRADLAAFLSAACLCCLLCADLCIHVLQ